VLRQDRGLTASEQDEYSQWLAADSRHRSAIALHRWGWEELDRLAGLQTSVHARPDPDLLTPGHSAWARPAPSPFRARVLRFAPVILAAAAAVALGLFLRSPRVGGLAVAPSTALAAPIEQRTLEDGSVIALNRGAEIALHYTAKERRVQLVRGEANFTVAKNRERPFVVSAGGVDVHAVGTVFNVRLAATAVDVLVTEGKVRVDAPPATAGARLAPLNLQVPVFLTANQRTTVALAPAEPPPQVATLNPNELAQHLAWQPRLLDFTDAPLADIVAVFNRHNPVRLVVADPALGATHLSATFRSDNVEGFVRLMESDFGMKAEWRSETEIVLHRAK
jgi:transmembrane sensor